MDRNIVRVRTKVAISVSGLARASWIEILSGEFKMRIRHGSGLARASWIEIGFVCFFASNGSCRGSREPRGSKFQTLLYIPFSLQSGLARASWIEISVQVTIWRTTPVGARESLVDRNHARAEVTDPEVMSGLARASWIEIINRLFGMYDSSVGARESLVDRNPS